MKGALYLDLHTADRIDRYLRKKSHSGRVAKTTLRDDLRE